MFLNSFLIVPKRKKVNITMMEEEDMQREAFENVGYVC